MRFPRSVRITLGGHQARGRPDVAGECSAFGLGAASLRYSTPRARSARWASATPESHLIPIVLDVAAGRRDELMLTATTTRPRRTCVRDYIHVADLAAAHLLALDAIKPSRHEIYNLATATATATSRSSRRFAR